MTGQMYLQRIAQLLLQHGIVQRITEEMMQKANQELYWHTIDPYLQQEEEFTCLLEVLRPFLSEVPTRFVWFDTEMDGPTYAELVFNFAEATGGEWAPQQVTYNSIPDKETDVHRLAVDFDMRDELIHGEWIIQSMGWIEDGFIDLIKSSTRSHLNAEFVEIPMHDQTRLFVYLPQPLSRDLQTLLVQLEQEYPNFGMFAQTFLEIGNK